MHRLSYAVKWWHVFLIGQMVYPFFNRKFCTWFRDALKNSGEHTKVEFNSLMMTFCSLLYLFIMLIFGNSLLFWGVWHWGYCNVSVILYISQIFLLPHNNFDLISLYLLQYSNTSCFNRLSWENLAGKGGIMRKSFLLKHLRKLS